MISSLLSERFEYNPNINSRFYVGKYNFEYEDKQFSSFCGKFAGNERENQYFKGIVKRNMLID